jgi:type VI secretion system protein ImpK
MTLLELSDPLFQFVCRLNRSMRKGASLAMDSVRSDVKAIFEDMRSKSSNDRALSAQYNQIELVLIFFVDFMIKESNLAFANEWQELADEHNELSGDEKFFDMLDQTLADNSDEASERLQVFYTCIGLGFSGFYTGQPEYLRKKMFEITPRLRKYGVVEDNVRICPDAYDHLDTSDLIEPPGKSLVGLVIALIGLLLVLFVANIYMYRTSSKGMAGSLESIIQLGEPGDKAKGGTP